MKLKLNSETIKALSREDGNQIAGGATTTQHGCNSNRGCWTTQVCQGHSLSSYCLCPTYPNAADPF